MVGIYRKAFTLIELIFAIIIMGITVVSVPVLMSSNTKGFDATIIQEAIFAASAELNQVLSYRWDENSIDKNIDPNESGLANVIETGDCSTTTRLRPGHIQQPLHRRCIDNNTTTPTLEAYFGLDNNETNATADDIDDINQNSKEMFIDSSGATATGTKSGYKHAYQSDLNITYKAIGTVSKASQNAKYIEIIVTNDSGDVVTKLRSYTLNIGEVDFYKRTY